MLSVTGECVVQPGPGILLPDLTLVVSHCLSPQASPAPDLNNPKDKAATPGFSKDHLQAEPCQPRCQTLPEPAALTLGTASPPRTLEHTPLLLELQKLPGLANTDLSAPNPNIQVRLKRGHLFRDL